MRVEPKPKVVAVWAQDENGVIGDGEKLLWKVPADMRHFRDTTMGCPVIMGRTSYEALPGPLVGRPMIVMTRQRDYTAEDATVVHSLDEALDAAAQHAAKTDAPTVCVIGGTQVFNQAMADTDELVVTYLDFAVPNPQGAPLVYAPDIDLETWVEDPDRTDTDWREPSGDGRWKVATFVRR